MEWNKDVKLWFDELKIVLFLDDIKYCVSGMIEVFAEIAVYKGRLTTESRLASIL